MVFTRLQLYSADKIEEGVITPCVKNNTKYEFAYDCRGGGQIFYSEGECKRPVQCGDADTYGKSLRIDLLRIKDRMLVSECRYTISIHDINVDRPFHLIGTHTYGQCGCIELVDLKIRVVAHPIVQILKIIRKILININSNYGKRENSIY